MSISSTRRDLLKGSLALAGMGMLGLPDWAEAALAEGETLVPFTDLPPTINLTPAPDRRIIDVQKIDGVFTPKDQFFTTQHYGHPVVDPAAFRLRIAGLVERPTETVITPPLRVPNVFPESIRLPSTARIRTKT